MTKCRVRQIRTMGETRIECKCEKRKGHSGKHKCTCGHEWPYETAKMKPLKGMVG